MRAVALAALLAACTPPTVGEWSGGVRGTVLTSWQPREYTEAATQRTLDQLVDMGADHVAVLTTWYMDDVSSNAILPDPDRSPTDIALRYALAQARKRGFRVALKPHVDVADDTWRGSITPTDRAAWYASYREFITWYARLARQEGVDVFVMGTEYASMSRDEAAWREIVAEVRRSYDGEIVYAANWDEYEQVQWWDAVDKIGVDAYFPLSSDNDPGDAALAGAWRDIATRLAQHGSRWDKQVLVTEFGYQARDGANVSPWWAPTDTPDTGEQARCLEAAYEAMSTEPGIDGSYLWKTFYDPAEDQDDFDVIGRLAEGVVQDAWLR
jgi:hypothetical protein